MEEVRVIYGWWPIDLSESEIDKIEQTIKDKDFKKFVNYYKKYNGFGLQEGEFDEEGNFTCKWYLSNMAYILEKDNDVILDTINIFEKANFEKINEIRRYEEEQKEELIEEEEINEYSESM